MRVAVIGNGPSVQRKGEEIDGNDLVVRLHDCHYQTPEDYGTRHDYGVLPGPWLSGALKGIRRKPAHGWWVYTFGRVLAPFPEDAEGFGFKFLQREAMQRTAPSGRYASLSRGFCALAMAIRKYPGSEITGYGFDALADTDNAGSWPNPESYRKMVETDMHDVPQYHVHEVHHDCVWEREKLLHLAEGNGCRLTL